MKTISYRTTDKPFPLNIMQMNGNIDVYRLISFQMCISFTLHHCHCEFAFLKTLNKPNEHVNISTQQTHTLF